MGHITKNKRVIMPADNTNDPNENNVESLEERSARMEAEADALYDAQQEYNAQQDPLAPTEIPEEEDSSVEALQDELAKAKDQMMRALAEAENARKRAQKDREDASRFAISGFARDLLDVADNLRRALDSVPEDLLAVDDRIKGVLDGIEATERTLLRSFEKNNIQKLEPVDQPFDPNFHEVMFESPVPGKVAGTVIQVIETGYTLNGRLLRPARVGVAKDDGSGGSATPEAGGDLDIEA